ncbi:MAG: LytTR family DNA-binding domain-containing protein [Lachnospiraceae bacterium]|nr:LytTR family DNA-binding domain-containing protein [Lachnospiraceae bacterium]
MIKIAVCEDCPMQMDVILELLKDYQNERPGMEMEISSFFSCEDLLENLKAGNVYELLLLDIIMPGLDGVGLAKEIRKKDHESTFIFITSSKDYAIEAFNVYAAHYIVKPLKKNNFFNELDRIISLPRNKTEEYFMLSLQDRTVKIPFSSIVCVELSGRRLLVRLENGEELYGKYIRKSFEQTVEPLLKDPRFFHAHKSYMLNLDYAEELKSDSFIMKNGIRVFISRKKYAEAKGRYLKGLDSV